MSPLTVIRPPWADELGRLNHAFPDIRLHGPTDLLVLATPEPEVRLVGVAAIQRHTTSPIAASAPCALQWTIRPRFAADEPHLVAAAVAHARTAGIDALQCELAGPIDSPAARVLAGSGFACERTEELWSIPVANYVKRLGALTAPLARRGAASGFRVGSPLPVQQEQIVALVSTAGLLSAERIRFSDETPHGYDRELSSVVLQADRVVAVILIRREATHAVIETRVVASEFIGKTNLPNALMLQRSADRACSARLDALLLTANPSYAAEIIHMARRFGGTCQRAHRFWVRQTG